MIIVTEICMKVKKIIINQISNIRLFKSGIFMEKISIMGDVKVSRDYETEIVFTVGIEQFEDVAQPGSILANCTETYP